MTFRMFARQVFSVVMSPWLGNTAGAVKVRIDPEAALTSHAGRQAVREALAHGDWLVARGVHNSDNAVSMLTNMPLSHAAIYDARAGEVIEADNHGVHSTPLDVFLGLSVRVLVVRPQWHGPASSAGAVERARSWIGQGYNYTGLAGLDSPERFYCTQLALEAYRPFILEPPLNPIPKVIAPGQMYHWGRILYDSGPEPGRGE